MGNRSLGYHLKTNDSFRIAHSVRHIADLQRKLGMDVESEQSYLEALRIYRDGTITQSTNLANALRGLAILLETGGRIPEAINAWIEAKQLYAAWNIQAGVDEAEEKLSALER